MAPVTQSPKKTPTPVKVKPALVSLKVVEPVSHSPIVADCVKPQEATDTVKSVAIKKMWMMVFTSAYGAMMSFPRISACYVPDVNDECDINDYDGW